MDNILIHTKNRKTKASLMTVLLLLSLTLPLFALTTASAAASVSLSVTSGPNGTAVRVTGTGFGASQVQSAANTPFAVTIDGLTTKATNYNVAWTAAQLLTTNASGHLDGYFIIGGTAGLYLAPGQHSVQISDGTAAPPAITFTITAPTVTLSPTSGPAGTSVLVTGSGFAKATTGAPAITNSVAAATFAGTAITVVAAATTATPTILSSNVIPVTGSSAGTYSGTVSLPGITTGSTFTLTDAHGNIATAAFTLTTPTVTLSPTSGPTGTVVTVTATGFGPGATFGGANTVKFGTADISATLTPAAPAVTQTGTSVFQFTVGSGSTQYVAGARTITVTDSLGNAATTTFTVTPKAPITLGSAVVDSATTYVPTTVVAALHVTGVTGFKASTALTLTGSPGIPAAWLVFAAGDLTTDANGAIVGPVISTTTAAAPAAGTYSVTLSDGTNSVTVVLTVTAGTDFLVITPTSGPPGTVVAVAAYGTSTTTITFDGTQPAGTVQCTANAWPAAPTVVGSLTVPTSVVGTHTITATGAVFNTLVYTTTGAPTISIVSPSSAALGTTVTIVGSGYKNSGAAAALTIDGVTVAAASSSFTATGQMIATFVVPPFVAGSHTIAAADGTGAPVNTAVATFTIVAASVTISPTSSVLGTATLSLTGSGFLAGETITVKFDATTITAATPVGLTVINNNGGILLNSGFNIPTSTVAGAHTVTVVGSTSGASATATFTVVPKITLTPSAIRAGATVVITGTGFGNAVLQTLTLNGTAASWYDTSVTPATLITGAVTTGATGDLAANRGTVISASAGTGSLTVTVTDGAGNTASATLTLLATPAITLVAAQTIGGAAVPVNGSGFTPGSRAVTAQLISSTDVVTALTVTTSPITVGATGTFASSATSINIPTGLIAGTYTVSVTIATPTETANASLTILGAPTVTASVTSAQVGQNVSMTVVGLTAVTVAQLGTTNLLGSFGSTTVTTTGTNAYNLTTWFVVPAIANGTYTLLVGDGTLIATSTLSIVPKATLTPTTAIKGTVVGVAGTGFAVTSNFNVTFNGVVLYNSATAVTTTTGVGSLPGGVTITIPATASATNTVMVVDAQGNSATATFTAANPTIIATPTSGVAGTTVQLLGSGFAAGSTIFIQVGTVVVTTSPTTIAGPSFLAYITIPAGTPAGDTIITATDALNNAASVTFSVSGTSATAPVVDSSTLSSSAQTQTGTGTAQASFTRGSQVNFGFSLKTTSGSGNVLWRVTVQQPNLAVSFMTFSSATVSTTAVSPVTGYILSATAPTGTYTAQIQIYASDGVTPLAVTTVTFTVT